MSPYKKSLRTNLLDLTEYATAVAIGTILLVPHHWLLFVILIIVRMLLKVSAQDSLAVDVEDGMKAAGYRNEVEESLGS